jgi:hypothetical protein
MVPERLQPAACAVKLTLARLAEFTVIAWLGGVNVKPVLVGVTVYEPLNRLLNA